MKNTVDDVFMKNRTIEEKFNKVDKDIVRFNKTANKMRGFEEMMHDMQQRIGKSGMQANFLAKSLPILIHIQTCEALEKVLGAEFRKTLIDFERFKINELYAYNQTATVDCVRIMHERLQSFLKWMYKEDKGVIPCTFGEDIRPNMEDEEAIYINNSYFVALSNRYQRL